MLGVYRRMGGFCISSIVDVCVHRFAILGVYWYITLISNWHTNPPTTCCCLEGAHSSDTPQPHNRWLPTISSRKAHRPVLPYLDTPKRPVTSDIIVSSYLSLKSTYEYQHHCAPSFSTMSTTKAPPSLQPSVFPSSNSGRQDLQDRWLRNAVVLVAEVFH